MGKSYKNRVEDQEIRGRRAPAYGRKDRRELDREVRKVLSSFNYYKEDYDSLSEQEDEVDY